MRLSEPSSSDTLNAVAGILSEAAHMSLEQARGKTRLGTWESLETSVQIFYAAC